MKELKIILIIFLLLILNNNSFATAQAPDYLIYKGDTLAIFSNPLEMYFEKHNKPDKLFEEYGFNSTGCYRGYIAYFELRNDSLFLNKIKGRNGDINLSLIIKDRKINGDVFADWFSGDIRIEEGKLVYCIHDAYESIYEKETIMTFKKGKFETKKQYDNSKSIVSEYVKDQELLMKFLEKNTNHSLLSDTVDKVAIYLRIESTNEQGKITQVKVMRGYNDILEKEAKRVLMSVPQWLYLYKEGKPYNETWTIPVIFDRKKIKN